MSDFEDRLREIARELSRTVERNLDDIAETFGVDPSRARGFAESAGQWLNDQVEDHGEQLFGQPIPTDPPVPVAPDPTAAPSSATPPAGRAGPHPLDLPTEPQGRALAALDSGRWTVRPGSNRLTGAGEGPDPAAGGEIVGELRARDWILATGELTLVGRRALGRWCDTAHERPAADDQPSAD